MGRTVVSPSRAAAIRFLTIGDIGERMDVAPRTVCRWIKSGALRVHRFGRQVRVSESDYVDFLARHRGD
jgi:excisionase family DNA binding protein